MDPLTIVDLLTKILGFASQAIPAVEQAIHQGQQIEGTTDPIALQSQIDSLHAQSLQLTAQLDALRSK